MRLFVAVHLPDDVQAAIQDAFAPISRERPRGLRFVKPDNIHLTIKFLGDTDEELLSDLKAGLKNIAREYAPFSLSIEGAGAFPNLKRPRVFWVGVTGDKDIISALAGDIEGVCAGLGFPREKRAYSPHLTVARVKSKKGLFEMTELVAGLENADFDTGPFKVTSFSLVQSTLTPKGAVYEDIANFELGEA
ncbi:MAG: RNA 2',3'-cyclic phosphodiesterase [bacterium]|nr:RNA 2',3'-cyclic phosphodiesterase [bacterium]